MKSARRIWTHYRMDWMLMGALFVFALIVRIPQLYNIPRFTDEVIEWQFALDIANGARSPFVGLQPYLGPFVSDVLALVLKIFPNPFVPRAFACVMGALTAPATYALARVIAGRRAGVIAGLLVAAASTHIVANSHIAYLNSLTPLFTALTLTMFYLARKRQDGRWLIACAFVFGLTLQTHPAAIAFVPGVAIWFLVSQRQWQWFRRASLYLASAAAIFAYSPVLVRVFTQSNETRAQIVTRSYAFAIPQSVGEYFANLQGLLVELARMLGAVYPNLNAPREYLMQPGVFLFLVLTVVAFWAMVRRRDFFLLSIIASVALLIPLFNRQYGDFPYFTRYIALLLPPIYAAVGLGADTLWSEITARFAGTRWHWTLRVVFSLGIFVLAILPLALTNEFYAGQTRGARTNALFLAMTDRIAQSPTLPILLDGALGNAEFPSGGNLLISFQTWFNFTRQSWTAANLNARRVRGCGQDGWLIALDENAASLTTSCPAERVVGDEIPTRPGRPSIRYSLYHLRAH